MTSARWPNKMSFTCIPPPTTIIWHLSMDKVPFGNFGIQLGDLEMPIQLKSEENCFEKTGLHPGGWLADHGPGCRHHLCPQISWKYPILGSSLLTVTVFKQACESRDTSIYNLEDSEKAVRRFWKFSALTPSWPQSTSSPVGIGPIGYSCLHLRRSRKGLILCFSPPAMEGRSTQRPHGTYLSSPSEPSLQMPVMAVEPETVVVLGSSPSQL